METKQSPQDTTEKKKKWSLSTLLFNNYFVAFFVFIIWMLFFDKNRVAVQWHLSGMITKLENDKSYYESEAKKVRSELNELSHNKEKYAREKYFMKRPNEDVFIIEENN